MPEGPTGACSRKPSTLGQNDRSCRSDRATKEDFTSRRFSDDPDAPIRS